MEAEDIMEFRQIVSPELAGNGQMVSYESTPDRGDGSVHVVDYTGHEMLQITRGTAPRLSGDSRWVKARIHLPYRQRLQEAGDPDSLAVIRTDRSDTLSFSGVQKAAFSENSRYLIILTSSEVEDSPGERSVPGGRLALYHLDDLQHIYQADYVRSFTMDSLSTQLVYSVVDSTGEGNGLFRVDLDEDTLTSRVIHRQTHAVYDGFSWYEEGRRLAFLYSREDEFGNASPSSLYVWDAADGELRQIVASDYFSGDRIVPLHSSLTWSNDGDRIFFGWQPLSMYRYSLYREEDTLYTVTDRDSILAGATVDVWHGNDPLIKSHEKHTWEERRDHTYLAVFHLNRNRLVELASDTVPYVYPADNNRYVLGRNPRPYKRKISWDGRYHDYYLVSLEDGAHTEVVHRLRSNTVSQSPGGRYVVFYESRNWHLFDVDRNIIRNITESLEVPFYDEDHDCPDPVPGYGMAGWVEGDRAVLLYDRYDVWQIDVRSGRTMNLTGGDGRNRQYQYRVERTDSERDYFLRNEHLLVRGFGERDKSYGFYGIRIGREGVERFAEGPYRYRFVESSRVDNRILYTRENYREFPDLWLADNRFQNQRKLTNENPQISEFNWGETQLVSWRDLDGNKLDGVLITPDDYVQGDRLPVLVYFYEQFSQRLNHFNEQVINHRPGFPYYVSNGYAIFLPDVRYDIGLPGYSATRSIVPGVKKLIGMGVADPDAIALHGHSWSGYQAAHMATQTHVFAAIIAGAPVSNMTSAYSGIRRGTGLARQFQYEQTQSRIGGSLWDKRDLYIENSPVFYADRIQTPVLIMFGDEDDAVPWEQGIELYLAMRRLHKDVIFLQYRGEPHHPQKYANKLDYYLRMREYLDYHLKGEPPAEWIRDGVPYRGR